MKQRAFISVIFFVSVSLLAGCSRRATGRYTEQQIASIVTNGAAKADVEQVFGDPEITLPGLQGSQWSYYKFPDRYLPSTFEHLLTGFQIEYKDGKALRWLPIYSDRQVTSQAGAIKLDSRNSRAGQPQPISVWVLHETNFPGAVAVSVSPLKKTDYVAKRPDLMFFTVKSVHPVSEISGSKSTPGLDVSLAPDDAKDLENFTETNIGSHVLILVGTNVVAAPIIQEPIKNGVFTITISDTSIYTNALNLLLVLSDNKK